MNTSLTRRSFAALIAGAGVAGVGGLITQARAAELGKPTGAPLLVVSGKIKNFNDGTHAVFDRPMLESLGMEKVTVTKTPWYKQSEEFEGVRMDKVMQSVGAFGDHVRASALNDYSVQLPVSDFAEYGTLLALKRNGQYMPVSDKGPLFIIYPFDSNPALQQDKFYSRSIWQLSAMDVR